MELTLLMVADCPNAPVLEERLAKLLAENGDQRGKIRLTRRVITSQAEADRYGMRGSPTLLVDGVDPFAERGSPASLSCRLYRNDHGQLTGAPSLASLRAALDQAASPTPRRSRPADRDRQDPVGRAGRGRLAPVEGGLRAMQQQVLRAFAQTGTAPSPTELEQAAAPYGAQAQAVLRELHDQDFLRLEDTEIRAAYPFSAVPTPHQVQIIGGPHVYAMCAIDALGIAAMLDTDIVITSPEPATGKQITVHVTPDGTSTWHPDTGAVFTGQLTDCGPCDNHPPAAAEVSCSTINFFTTHAAARHWATTHPDVDGEILTPQQALQTGIAIFGDLLTAPLDSLMVAEDIKLHIQQVRLWP